MPGVGSQWQNLPVSQRWSILPSAILLACAGVQTVYQAWRGGPLESRWESIGLLGLLGLAGVVNWLVFRSAGVRHRFGKFGERLRHTRLAFPLLLVLCWWLAFGSLGRFVEPLAVRASLYWLVALAAAAALAAWNSSSQPSGRLVASLLILGVGHRLLLHLPEVSTYPLALGWSETSRYYYGSLFFSERLYGMSVPVSVLHPSRYLLQAIPFLVTRDMLWLHRAWQVLLWLGLPALAAGLLVRRLAWGTKWQAWLVGGWAFLFLLQGPVLFHLVVPVVVVLAGVKSSRPLQSLLVVMLASAWAGISRINWLPVPGFLAATVYLLETMPKDRSWLRDLVWPAVWIVVGSLTGLAANAAYVLLSGNSATEFSSSFTSDLLWYRLLPNPTFLPGILLGVALASLPVAWLIARRRAVWGWLPPMRLLALGSMLAVLLVGGILVSVKIGGGSNLHNMDAYLALLLVVGAYLLAGHPAPAPQQVQPSWALAAAAIAVPLAFSLSVGGRLQWPSPAQGERIVEALRQELAGFSEEDDVLFITERHLLTFGRINSVTLVPAHEKVFLMEMAMGNTRSYLDSFEQALAEQRYELIISEPLKVQYQGSSRAFGEENDVWVERVAIPVLCYYQPVRTLEGAPIQLLEPRPDGRHCPTEDG